MKKLLISIVCSAGILLGYTWAQVNGPDSFKIEVNPIILQQNVPADITITAMKNGSPYLYYTGDIFITIDGLELRDFTLPNQWRYQFAPEDRGKITFNKRLEIQKEGKFTIRATNYNDTIVGSLTVTVINASSALSNAIERAYQQGLTQYSTASAFMQHNFLRRDEATKFYVEFAKVLGKTEYTVDANICNRFTDMQKAFPNLRPYIVEACRMGIFKGENGKFYPADNLSNEQAIAVLMRIIDGNQPESWSDWTANYYKRANELEVLSNVNMNNKKGEATRGNVILAIYNAKNLKNNKTETKNTEETIPFLIINEETKDNTNEEAKLLSNRTIDGQTSLNSLTNIDEKTAKAIATFWGDELSLDWLQTIDEPTAKALATFWGDYLLSLKWLKTINESIAKALATFWGDYLSLNWLQTIDEPTAKALATFWGDGLELEWLQTINQPITTALATFWGDFLSLSWLQNINTSIAKALATFWGTSLFLDWLQNIDEPTAKALATFWGYGLRLGWLQTINESTANALASFWGKYLSLNWLQTINESTAKALATFWGDELNLEGLQTINESTAKALATFWGDGFLGVRWLQTIDESTAKALATFWGKYLSLKWLQTINEPITKALATFWGTMSF